MDKRVYFLEIYKKAYKKYGKSSKRLAGQKWGSAWRTLIVTILSAQSRDEITIPVAKKLFKRYGSLESLARAHPPTLRKLLRSINYYKTKSRNVKAAAKFILKEFNGKVPDEIEELVRIPGVGRKTANLVRTEWYGKDGICVDTHVHRISNVLGLVKTKTPTHTEAELEKIVPKRLWGRVNRMFVLWGKEVPGRDKNKLLRSLEK
jgi:endonuclease III